MLQGKRRRHATPFPFHRALGPSASHTRRPVAHSPWEWPRATPTWARTVASSRGAVRLRLNAPASPAHSSRWLPVSRPSRLHVAIGTQPRAGHLVAGVRGSRATTGRVVRPGPARRGADFLDELGKLGPSPSCASGLGWDRRRLSQVSEACPVSVYLQHYWQDWGFHFLWRTVPPVL